MSFQIPQFLSNLPPYALVLICLIVSPIVGGLIAGFDRRITARMQHRYGPPILQPFYDFFKLLGKESIIVSSDQVIYVMLYLVFNVLALVMLVLQMDLLLILFMLAFAVCAIILGAMGVNSPYSKLGAQRELIALLTYEPILIAVVIGIFFVTGSFKVADVMQHPKMLILDLPLLFIAFTYVLTVKLKKSPFDFSTSHHAHQELVKGLTTEFSGPTLAIIELTHWYETVFLLLFIGLFFANNIPLAILVALLCYFAEIVVDNIAARMTWQIMLRWGWTYGIFLCIVNLAWVYLKYSS